MELDEIITKLDETLVITKKEFENNRLNIYCEISARTSKCKYCHQESKSIHSKYIRTVSDLPM